MIRIKVNLALFFCPFGAIESKWIFISHTQTIGKDGPRDQRKEKKWTHHTQHHPMDNFCRQSPSPYGKKSPRPILSIFINGSQRRPVRGQL